MGVEGVDRTWIKAFKGLKKFSGWWWWWWWSPSENSVCPRPLLQFMSVRLCQFMSEGVDVELDKKEIRQKQVNKRQGKDRDKIREEEGKKVGRGGLEVREW